MIIAVADELMKVQRCAQGDAVHVGVLQIAQVENQGLCKSTECDDDHRNVRQRLCLHRVLPDWNLPPSCRQVSVTLSV
jgi:hypothetical protein